MPKRTDIRKIMIIGAGPIVIGQACEFDYSGTQACKALKEEGYEVILVNSNPATIMTDPAMADRTYIEPLTVEIVTAILENERPDAILPTVGGQTGLNLAMDLHRSGILAKLNIEMIGAKPEAIEKAEGRASFKKAMESINLESAKSVTAYTLDEAREGAKQMGFPCVVRPAFTLGGSGGGIAYSMEELEGIVASGLQNSHISEVLIEESIIGWKEYELEVMRDKQDNVVIVCSIENFDAMGVHTGDSITVAPAQTLSDKEYQKLRDASIAIIREIGVDTGGSNIQFAVNPKDGRIIVIEMNPRVSRSSALASKATGFPIAKLAAKLAVGYTLNELQNDITKKTPASFEPALDYVVVKIPRFNFDKFPKSLPYLGTAMKSVGEAMAIGRTFKEAFQKAIRSLEIKRFGFGYDGKELQNVDKATLHNYLSKPNSERIFYIQYALEAGMTIDELYRITHIDPWFLNQLKQLVDYKQTITLDHDSLLKAKQWGFSDVQLSKITDMSEVAFRAHRKQLGLLPTYSIVDTCAGEFDAETPYYYSTYETVNEWRPSTKKKIMILGGGPNRIGQGIEFDYCCVHASFAIREEGFESIMVNSNPETVSTDFDISDKLYFEPLTFEDVMNIYELEKPEGVIIQFGGQTPLNLSIALEKAGAKILGTSSNSIDLAEDRKRFQELLHQLHLKQPENGTVTSFEEAVQVANRIEYPVVVRPSYVLGGASMEIVYSESELKRYMTQAKDVSPSHPILIDKFLKDAIEVDVDSLSDGQDTVIAGIMEHIEEAGIHSGDSACVLPPYTLDQAMIEKIRISTKKIATALNIIGLMNIQFAVEDHELYVLEVNPRGSRTVPFVSKATGVPWAKMATKVILGKTIKELGLTEIIPPYISVKEAVFPFNKFPGTDTLLGPEMKSTGEVMGIDSTFGRAFLKAQLAASQFLPKTGNTVLISVNNKDKQRVIPLASLLQGMGYKIVTTEGTAKLMQAENIPVEVVKKMHQGNPNILDVLQSGKVSMVINTSTKELVQEEKLFREAILSARIPFISTIRGGFAAAMALQALKEGPLESLPLQVLFSQHHVTNA